MPVAASSRRESPANSVKREAVLQVPIGGRISGVVVVHESIATGPTKDGNSRKDKKCGDQDVGLKCEAPARACGSAPCQAIRRTRAAHEQCCPEMPAGGAWGGLVDIMANGPRFGPRLRFGLVWEQRSGPRWRFGLVWVW